GRAAHFVPSCQTLGTTPAARNANRSAAGGAEAAGDAGSRSGRDSESGSEASAGSRSSCHSRTPQAARKITITMQPGEYQVKSTQACRTPPVNPASTADWHAATVFDD